MNMIEPTLEQLSDIKIVEMALGYKANASYHERAKKFMEKVKTLGEYRPGDTKDKQLEAVWELSKRFAGKKTLVYLKPRDIWEELRDIRGAKKEHFVIFFLDTRNQEVHREIISIGTLNYNMVHPREVFRPAILASAAGVILAHNHPSGCLDPSDEDLALNKRLINGGKLIGIDVLDHVIVTKDTFTSCKQRNLM